MNPILSPSLICNERRTALKFFAVSLLAGVIPALPRDARAFWPLVFRGAAFVLRASARSAAHQAIRKGLRGASRGAAKRGKPSVSGQAIKTMDNSLDIIELALNADSAMALERSGGKVQPGTEAILSGQLYKCETQSASSGLEVYTQNDPWDPSSQPDQWLYQDICQAMGADQRLIKLARQAHAHAIWVADQPGYVYLELENSGSSPVNTGDIQLLLFNLEQGRLSPQAEDKKIIPSMKLSSGVTPKSVMLGGNLTSGIKQLKIVHQQRSATVGNILVV